MSLFTEKAIKRSLLSAAVLGFALLGLVMVAELIGQHSNVSFEMVNHLIPVFSDGFLLAMFFYHKRRFSVLKTNSFLELLNPVFYRGLGILAYSLVVWGFYHLMGGTALEADHFTENILHLFFFGFVGIFLISTFFTWKRLINFQKSKTLGKFWNVFEYLILASILLDFFALGFDDVFFVSILSVVSFLGLILSFNLRWVAYLNIAQKWKSILMMLAILSISVFAIDEAFDFSESRMLLFNLENKLFIAALFAFACTYSLISILVLLFNLPTTSVFEQKFDDVLNFQRLNQTIQLGETESDIADEILYISIESAYADAGWIDIFSFKTSSAIIRTQNIEFSFIDTLRTKIFEEHTGPLGELYFKNIWIASDHTVKYNAALVVPLITSGQEFGQMVLLTSSIDGFDNETIDLVKTYAGQGSVKIQNFRLLIEKQESEKENERIQDELRIAREVQRYLLPSVVPVNEYFEVAAFAESAMEVGGDYYDIHEYPDGSTAFVIADVSGKGTSAAFSMAQMKGIFQSLTLLNIPASDFIRLTNLALANGMAETAFITMFYLMVDRKRRSFVYTRAGHCPGLLYEAGTGEVKLLNAKGLGLGIIRDETYGQYVFSEEIAYSSGDIVLLYTDGVVESNNERKEEYGMEKLMVFLVENAQFNAEQIKQNLVNDIHRFCGKEIFFDDLSILVIKFK